MSSILPSQPQKPPLEKEEEEQQGHTTPTTRSSISNLTHDIELSNLFDFYEIEILGSLRVKFRYERIQNVALHRRNLLQKECRHICNTIPFSYADCAIYRNPTQTFFGQRLMDLDYRYCKDCKRLMPQSVIWEMEDQRNLKMKKKRVERSASSPVYCPCCDRRTSRAYVFIRKTNMRKFLFKSEGY